VKSFNTQLSSTAATALVAAVQIGLRLSNRNRTTVKSKSNRKCNHRINVHAIGQLVRRHCNENFARPNRIEMISINQSNLFVKHTEVW